MDLLGFDFGGFAISTGTLFLIGLFVFTCMGRD